MNNMTHNQYAYTRGYVMVTGENRAEFLTEKGHLRCMHTDLYNAKYGCEFEPGYVFIGPDDHVKEEPPLTWSMLHWIYSFLFSSLQHHKEHGTFLEEVEDSEDSFYKAVRQNRLQNDVYDHDKKAMEYQWSLSVHYALDHAKEWTNLPRIKEILSVVWKLPNPTYLWKMSTLCDIAHRYLCKERRPNFSEYTDLIEDVIRSENIPLDIKTNRDLYELTGKVGLLSVMQEIYRTWERKQKHLFFMTIPFRLNRFRWNSVRNQNTPDILARRGVFTIRSV